ncbi:hypothetical protein OIO90_005513 [Microbotryomycetes sp. JL221]|nr:hypothetical protein OIO90_005513 [Microbotryomycetes sp. JL221]
MTSPRLPSNSLDIRSQSRQSTSSSHGNGAVSGLLTPPTSRSPRVGSPLSVGIPQIPARQTTTDSASSSSQQLASLSTSSSSNLTARQATSSSSLSATRPSQHSLTSGLVQHKSQDSVPTLSSTTTTTELTDQQKAEIVRRHLLSAEDQQAIAQEAAQNTSSINDTAVTALNDGSAVDTARVLVAGDEQYPTPYHLEGGDVVADVYKWAARESQQALTSAGAGDASASGGASLRRSRSMASIDVVGTVGSRRTSMAVNERPSLEQLRGGEAPVSSSASAIATDDDGTVPDGLAVKQMLEPGGFRRDFIVRRMAEQQQHDDASASGVSVAGQNGTVVARPPVLRTKSFGEFLALYGHYAGEDLEEIEEEEDGDDQDEEEQVASERTPLVRGRPRGPPRSDSRKRASSSSRQGSATVTQAVLMLLKSFVGTGVLFLGKAFFNGGLLFSTIVLCAIAMISLYSFLLLVSTRLVVHGSFGDIGGILYGKYMRWCILFSIVLSQIGFVAAYTIFVSENLQAFFMAVSNCSKYVDIKYLIFAQLVIFLPFAMIRNIQKLSGTALVADAFILFGLVYIFSNEIKVLSNFGIADVVMFNKKDFPLLIGTAVFSFEGIGLVIPITESMAEPHRFPKVLSGVMVGVMVLFAGGGALAYSAYGSKIQTVVFVNLPQEDKFVQASQFLYSIAILLSTPLQLFPAVRIMENGIFQRSGKHSNKVKWQKNMFRSLCVVGCCLVAWVGAADLDKFVSLVGSLACVPLCFCYPALLHYRACARSRKQKVADIVLFVFGLFATVYTTSQTIQMLLSGGQSSPPQFGKCPPRQ